MSTKGSVKPDGPPCNILDNSLKYLTYGMVQVGKYLGLGVELDAPLVSLFEEQLGVVPLVVVRVFEVLCCEQLVDILGVADEAAGVEEPTYEKRHKKLK